MNVSAIQPTSYQPYSPSDKRASPPEKVYNRDIGADTINFSDEARALAYGKYIGEEAPEETVMELPEKTTETQDVKPSEVVPKSINFLSMLLEAFLLAKLEENEENAPNPNAASEQPDTQNTQNTQSVESPNGQQASTQPNTAGQEATKAKPSGVIDKGGKVSEIKQTINNFIMGKADMSDVSKAISSSKGSSSTATTGTTAGATPTAKKDSDGPKLLVM